LSGCEDFEAVFGNTPDWYGPIYTTFEWGWTQTIYTEEEVGAQGMIQALAYNWINATSKAYALTIYIGHTT
jgi:hypothetical protein